VDIADTDPTPKDTDAEQAAFHEAHKVPIAKINKDEQMGTLHLLLNMCLFLH
jgi:hypothetical protein